MANALCTVGLSLGFGNCLVLPLPVTVIHLSSLFSPSSNVPAHRHSLSESFFSAYPPKSASLSFSFFLFSQALAFLGILCSHSLDLRCSSDEPLSELAPYADSVYFVSVLLFSIIELRYETELATE